MNKTIRKSSITIIAATKQTVSIFHRIYLQILLHRAAKSDSYRLLMCLMHESELDRFPPNLFRINAKTAINFKSGDKTFGATGRDWFSQIISKWLGVKA